MNPWSNNAAILLGRKSTGLLLLNDPVLQPKQVRVEIRYTAICGTQLGEWLQNRGPDEFLPHCFGHEAVGKVLEIGSEVQGFSVGEFVVVSWITNTHRVGSEVPKFSGAPSVLGPQLSSLVNCGRCATFLKRAVVSEEHLTGISIKEPLPIHSLLGCALLTARANLEVVRFNCVPKETPIALFGLGGIGLCTALLLMADGYQTIGFDEKFSLESHELARLNMTAGVDPIDPNLRGSLKCALVTAGSVSAISAAQHLLDPKGGVLGISGNLPHGEFASIDVKPLLYGRNIIGVGERFVKPSKVIPEILTVIERFPWAHDLLIHSVEPFENINDIFEDLYKNGGKRRVLSMKHEGDQ